jgi:hypothetical protein
MGDACDRRDRRYRFEVTAAILSRNVPLSAVTENVSYRGTFLRTKAKVAMRELVRVRFTLPDGRTILAQGMVVHVVGPNDAEGRPEGMGLQFYGMDGEPRVQWEKLVTSVRDQTNDASQVVALPRAPAIGRTVLDMRVATRDALQRFIAQDLARIIVIRTAEALAVGTEVTLRLVHPDFDRTFSLECVVRRRMFGTHAGVGVELLFLNDEIRRALADFVRPVAGEDIEVVWAEGDDSPSVVRARARKRTA